MTPGAFISEMPCFVCTSWFCLSDARANPLSRQLHDILASYACEYSRGPGVRGTVGFATGWCWR
jgi:hypothetical protein